MVKHLDIIELFVENGATFDELVPSGDKLGCISPYSEDHELERLYKIGLDAKKGYCKVKPSCYESPMFQFIGRKGQQREVETIKVAIQNGFDINESYCGRSLVDVIKQESRPGMVETLTNYQNSITLSAE